MIKYVIKYVYTSEIVRICAAVEPPEPLCRPCIFDGEYDVSVASLPQASLSLLGDEMWNTWHKASVWGVESVNDKGAVWIE